MANNETHTVAVQPSATAELKPEAAIAPYTAAFFLGMGAIFSALLTIYFSMDPWKALQLPPMGKNCWHSLSTYPAN